MSSGQCGLYSLVCFRVADQTREAQRYQHSSDSARRSARPRCVLAGCQIPARSGRSVKVWSFGEGLKLEGNFEGHGHHSIWWCSPKVGRFASSQDLSVLFGTSLQ